jgi:hypothetical protein
MIIKFNLFESVNYIPRIKMNGVYYHGTIIQDNELITELTMGYSDFDAIWVTDNEKIAEEFAKDKQYDDNEIVVVYKVIVKSNKIADIDYSTSNQLIDKYELDDFRDIIEILKSKGYNGWKTPGSIGRNLYNDFAIFYKDLINIKDVKFFINNQWTEYMSLPNAEKFLESL